MIFGYDEPNLLIVRELGQVKIFFENVMKITLKCFV